jgi:transcriptional regulator with XRE-family HTH domain
MAIPDARWADLSVGLAIRRRRKMRRLSQEAAAVAADVDLDHLRKIERGAARAQAATLARIAIALDCGVADLLVGLSGPRCR